MLEQKERDDNISHLLEVITDIYAFVLEAESIKIESHRKILVVMVQQTTECSYFIRQYASNASFSRTLFPHEATISQIISRIGKRLLEHILSDADSKIKQYEDKFEELKAAFQGRAVLETEITVLRILDMLESQGQNNSLHMGTIFDV